MPFLLDVNILIALLHLRHEFNERAESWFYAEGHRSWLTCPTTENGVVRIMGGPKFPSRQAHSEIAFRLQTLIRATSHRFVSDDISILDESQVALEAIGTSARLTDAYLLALAVKHNAIFATMDGRMNPSTVRNGAAHLLVIPT